jgi:predicted nucleotidyltransferase
MNGTALTSLERQLAALVAARAALQPASERVWVFGSRARGASTEFSDLDIAVEFSVPGSPELRRWLDCLRVETEAPVADQWPGFVNLTGLFAEDADSRLLHRVREEGLLVWARQPSSASLASLSER